MIECGKTLLNAFLYKGPFGSGNNARNNIKRENLFYPLATIIYGKGNALAHEKAFGQIFFFVQIISRFFRDIFNNLTIMIANVVICAIHFVPNAAYGAVFIKIS